MSDNIASVTVAFNPEPTRFCAQLAALCEQVGQVIVVDNGSQPSAESLIPTALAARICWAREERNVGIASALNRGIAIAQRQAAEFVLTMDHDSVPDQTMVASLHQALTGLEQGGTPVAAVGPRIADARNRDDYPFVTLGWLTNRKTHCSDEAGLLSCDLLITSGTLARTAMFSGSSVGPFDASLFIDSVDLEWSFRARSRGYLLFGICAARLDHRLGDRRIRVMPGLALVVHSPVRLYYMTRNRVALYRRGYVPLKWKLKDVLRMYAKLIGVLLFMKPRGRYLAMSIAGTVDAIKGVSGAISQRRDHEKA